METPQLARAITLLDQIKEEAEALASRTGYAAATSIHTKATECQNILIGAQPTRPEDN